MVWLLCCDMARRCVALHVLVWCDGACRSLALRGVMQCGVMWSDGDGAWRDADWSWSGMQRSYVAWRRVWSGMEWSGVEVE